MWCADSRQGETVSIFNCFLYSLPWCCVPCLLLAPFALQLELVQAKQQDITGLAEAAATRERRMEEMEEAIGALQEAVAALPPAGDMGEPGRQRLQLSRELGDINTQAWLFVLCAGLLVACCLVSAAWLFVVCCL
jgi:hypothetical protein